MSCTYYRVKYNRRVLGYYLTRDEARAYCEKYARRINPPTVSPTKLVSTAVEFKIELMQDEKVISTEYYTVIIAMRR